MGMPKGRVYTVVFTNVSVAVAQDLLEATPAANKQIWLKGFDISQIGTADVGDAAEEFIGITVVRGNATSGSGGSAPTPSPLEPSDTAAGFAAEVNNTTVASTGTPITLWSHAFNVRGPYTYWWPDGLEPGCTAGQNRMCVRSSAPADAITLSGTFTLIEAG